MASNEHGEGLPSFTVKDWTGSRAVRVKTLELAPFPLVLVLADGGMLSFQYTGTPAQARELASALNACANALEVEVMEVAP